MRDPLNASTGHVSRRRLFAMSGGATFAVALVSPSLAARQVDQATPTAAVPLSETPPFPQFPMPGTLAEDASPLFRRVTEALVSAMRQTLVPGAAIGLLTGGREEHATFGLESLPSMNPVMPDTLFQIGSITKTVTATAIWRLIDQGALDLEAPIQTYLPNLTLLDSTVVQKVTIGNLLDHSAGWYGDEGFDTGEGDDAIARYVAERLPQLPQIFPLGEFFSYNNAAFTVLGRLIEVATGTEYNAAIQDLVLDPLGLHDSFMEPVAVRNRPYAEGHTALSINGQIAAAVQIPLWIPRSVYPAGGLWSTSRDLMRYARFHMNQDTAEGVANIVQPESLALMQEPTINIPGTAVQMGRDWFVQDVDGVRAVYHGGDTTGQHAELIMIPEHDFSMVVLTNGQGGGGFAVAAALDAALDEVPELASLVGQIGLTRALSVTADAQTVDLTDRQLDEHAGRYADLGEALIFTRTGEGLQVARETIYQPGVYSSAINPLPAPPAPVAFIEEDVAAVYGGRLPFVRDSDGQIGWVSSGLRLLPRVEDE